MISCSPVVMLSSAWCGSLTKHQQKIFIDHTSGADFSTLLRFDSRFAPSSSSLGRPPSSLLSAATWKGCHHGFWSFAFGKRTSWATRTGSLAFSHSLTVKRFTFCLSKKWFDNLPLVCKTFWRKNFHLQVTGILDTGLCLLDWKLI